MKVTNLTGNVSFNSDGKLALVNYSVVVSGGEYPNTFTANLLVEPTDGIDINSTKDVISQIAINKIKQLVSTDTTQTD